MQALPQQNVPKCCIHLELAERPESASTARQVIFDRTPGCPWRTLGSSGKTLVSAREPVNRDVDVTLRPCLVAAVRIRGGEGVDLWEALSIID